MEENIEFITLKEASKIAGCTPEHLNLMSRKGKLKALKLGRNWYTKKEWINEYLITNKSRRSNITVSEINNFHAEDKVKIIKEEISLQEIEKDKDEKEQYKFALSRKYESEEEIREKIRLNRKAKNYQSDYVNNEEQKKIESPFKTEIASAEKINSLHKEKIDSNKLQGSILNLRSIELKAKNQAEDKKSKSQHIKSEMHETIKGEKKLKTKKYDLRNFGLTQSIARFKKIVPVVIAAAVILFVMPTIKYYWIKNNQTKKIFENVDESIIFNENTGAVKGEEIEKINDIEKGVVLASENYKIKQVQFGGDPIVIDEDKRRLEVLNVRSETFLAKSQDEAKLVITWQTSKPAISEINISKNNGQGMRNLKEAGYGYNHGVLITGLELDQGYIYEIKARDRWNNLGSSGAFAVYSGKKAVSIIDLIIGELQKMFGWMRT